MNLDRILTDRELFEQHLDNSRFTYEKGKLTCTECRCTIRVDDWPDHKMWHLKLYDLFETK